MLDLNVFQRFQHQSIGWDTGETQGDDSLVFHFRSLGEGYLGSGGSPNHARFSSPIRLGRHRLDIYMDGHLVGEDHRIGLQTYLLAVNIDFPAVYYLRDKQGHYPAIFPTGRWGDPGSGLAGTK